MKRTIALVLALVLCLALFAGCGSKQEAASGSEEPAATGDKPLCRVPEFFGLGKHCLCFHFEFIESAGRFLVQMLERLLGHHTFITVGLEHFHRSIVADIEQRIYIAQVICTV